MRHDRGSRSWVAVAISSRGRKMSMLHIRKYQFIEYIFSIVTDAQRRAEMFNMLSIVTSLAEVRVGGADSPAPEVVIV